MLSDGDNLVLVVLMAALNSCHCLINSGFFVFRDLQFYFQGYKSIRRHFCDEAVMRNVGCAVSESMVLRVIASFAAIEPSVIHPKPTQNEAPTILISLQGFHKAQARNDIIWRLFAGLVN